MLRITLGMAIAATFAGSAFAQETAKPVRQVYLCSADQMTKRAFTREFGAQEFVRAEDAARSKDAWATPKCITASEHQRLKRMQVATRVQIAAR